MEQYAIIMGETFLSWNALILTAAAAVSICFFLAFYLGKTGNAIAGFVAVPVCLVLSLVCPAGSICRVPAGGRDCPGAVSEPESAPDAGLHGHCRLRRNGGGTAGFLFQ